MKIEASISLRKRHEEVKFHGESDYFSLGLGRARIGCGGCLAQTRHQQSNLLPKEEQVDVALCQRAQNSCKV
jgi:hypothetical protein